MRDFRNERLEANQFGVLTADGLEIGIRWDNPYINTEALSYAEEAELLHQLAARWNVCADALARAADPNADPADMLPDVLQILRRAIYGED